MEIRAKVLLDASDVKRGERQASQSLDRLSRNARQAAGRMKKSFAGIRNSIFSVRSAILTLFAGFSFASIIGESRQFGKAVADLAAITGATGASLKFLSDASREFGATTTLSASEAADAFKLIASANPLLLDNVRALKEVTKQTIILAEATGQDLPTAARTLGAALNQFGAGADQAGRFINVLAAGAQRGAATVAEAAESLKFAGTVAASMGVKFETAVAAIQQMSRVAIKGGEAGTGLRNVILRLEQSADRNLRPSVVGLKGALTNLNEEMLTTPELIEKFGFRSIVAAKSLLSNVDALKQLEEEITGTNTALEQQAVKVNTLDGDLKQLRSAFSELKIAIGTEADDAMRAFTQSITGLTRSIADNIEQILEVGKAITKVLIAFTAGRLLGPIIASITRATGSLVLAVKAFNVTLIGSGASMGVARAGMIALTGTLGILRGAFALLGGPVGVIITAASALLLFASNAEAAAPKIKNFSSDVEQLKLRISGLSATELAITGVADIKNKLNDVTKEIAAGEERAEELGNKLTEMAENGTAALKAYVKELKAVGPAILENAVREQFEVGGDQVGTGRGATKRAALSKRARQEALDAAIAKQELAAAQASNLESQAALETQLTKAEEVIAASTPEGIAAAKLAAEAKQAEADLVKKVLEAKELLGGAVSTADQIQAFKDEITALEQVQRELETSGADTIAMYESGSVTLEGVKAKIAAVKKEMAAVGKETVKTTTAQREINKQTTLYEGAAQALERRLAGLSASTEENKNKQTQLNIAYEITKGRLKDLTPEQKTQLENLAKEFDAKSKILKMEAEITAKHQAAEKERENQIDAARDEARALEELLDPAKRYASAIERLNELRVLGGLSAEDYAEAVYNEALRTNQAAKTIRDGFSGLFTDLMDGSKSLSEAFNDMADNIVSSMNKIVSDELADDLMRSLFPEIGPDQQGAGGILDIFKGGGGATAAIAGSKTKGEMLGTTTNPMAVQMVDGAATVEQAMGGDLVEEQKKQSTSFFDFMTNGANKLWTYLKGGFQTLIGGIGEGFSGLWSGLSGMFSGGGGGGGGLIASIAGLFGFAHGGAFQMPKRALSGALAASMALPAFAQGGAMFKASPNELVTVHDKFAAGGAFRVGGSGGIDSQLVSMKAAQGAVITVTRPEQQSRLPAFAAGGMMSMFDNLVAQPAAAPAAQQSQPQTHVTVNNTFSVSAPQGRIDRESQAQMAARVGRSIDQAMRRNT